MPQEISRREFSMIVGAAVSAGVAVPRSLAALVRHRRAPFFTWVDIDPRVRVATGAGGNATVIRGPQDATLIDTKYFGLGDTLRREAEEFAGPLTAVVNTHHHPDHSGGNSAFGDLPLIAHENGTERTSATAQATMERIDDADGFLEIIESRYGERLDDASRGEIREFANAIGQLQVSDFVPDVTFQRWYAMDGLGQDVGLRYVSDGHTDNDAYLFLPEQNIMIAGDLLFHHLHPYMAPDDGTTSVGWQRCLAAMISTCDEDTRVVPGHGELTDRTGLREQSDYFDRLRDLVITAAEQGGTRENIVEMQVSEFEDYGFSNFLARNLGIMYDELA